LNTSFALKRNEAECCDFAACAAIEPETPIRLTFPLCNPASGTSWRGQTAEGAGKGKTRGNDGIRFVSFESAFLQQGENKGNLQKMEQKRELSQLPKLLIFNKVRAKGLEPSQGCPH
jgi:hypothetical protein